MKRSDLNSEEYPTYHGAYIEALDDLDMIDTLEKSEKQVIDIFSKVDEKDANFRYAEGKWSIKEVLLHLIDTERIFVYRALRFARKDFTDVPGFDQDVYVANSNSEDRSLKSILDEYSVQRRNTISFYKNLSEESLRQIDRPNGKRLSVRASAFFISGHELHHAQVVLEKYQKN